MQCTSLEHYDVFLENSKFGEVEFSSIYFMCDVCMTMHH